MGARAGKYKMWVWAGKYKLRARAAKYKLGAKSSKYKLKTMAGDWGRGPEPGPADKQRAGDGKIYKDPFSQLT